MTAGELVIFIILSGTLQGLIAAVVFAQAIKNFSPLKLRIDVYPQGAADARGRIMDDDNG